MGRFAVGSFIFLIVLSIFTSSKAFANGCDDDAPPCPAQFFDEFDTLKDESEETCFASSERTVSRCDLDAQPELIKAQHKVEEKFTIVSKADQDSMNAPCQEFASASSTLQFELAGFKSNCKEKQQICYSDCKERREEFEELKKQTAKYACCSTLTANIGTFMDKKIKEWRAACKEQDVQVSKASKRQDHWNGAQQTSLQCYNQTTEPAGNANATGAISATADTLNAKQAMADDPKKNGNVNANGVRAQATTKSRADNSKSNPSSGDRNTSLRSRDSRGRTGSSDSRNFGYGGTADGEPEKSLHEEMVGGMLDDILGADSGSMAGKGKKAFSGAGGGVRAAATDSKEGVGPVGRNSATDQRFDGAVSDLFDDESTDGVIHTYKRRVPQRGASPKNSGSEAYDRVANYRKKIAGTNEFNIVDGITPSHGKTIWDKVSERYQAVQSGLHP